MPGLLPLKVLILEDQPSDAELMVDELRQSGFAPEWVRVETKAEYLDQLNPSLDVILADHTLPQFNGLTALILLQERGLDIPFIIVSGSITEELAVSIMRQGAADYLLKDRMTRLGQSVIKVIADKKLRDQQHKAEAMLRASEARYRTLVEQASDGIFIANSEGRYIDVNASGCQMLGYSRDEILEKSMRDLTRVSSDRPLRFEELRQGKTLISNREMISKDGTLVPVEISAKQLSDGSFQGIVRDITERKRAENELRKLYTSVEQSGSSIIITDLQGSIEYVNRRFTDITGYSAAEVIGKNPRILKSGETSPAVYKQLWETIKAGGTWHGEFHNRKKNGELFWELASISSIIDSEGQVVNFLAVKDDISEYKRSNEKIAASEKRYRRLFESAKDGILIINANTGQVVDVNPYLCELLNYSVDEFIGKELWEIGLFQDIAASREGFRELQDRGYIRYEDLPLETRDGRKIAVEFVSNVYLVNGEKVIQCNIRDITERKRAEEKLHDSELQYRQLIDNLHSAVLVHVPDTSIILFNQTACDLLGLNPDQMKGKTADDLAWNFIREDGIPMSLEEYPINRVLVSRKPLVNLQLGIKQPQMENIVWVLVNAFPELDESHEIKQVVVTFIDITERKQAQELLDRERNLLRTLIDSLPDRIYAKDNKGRFTIKNQADVHQIGAASTDEIIGKTDFDYYPEEIAEQYTRDDQAVISSGQALIDREEKVTTMHGTPGWILTSKVPLRDTRGNVIGLVGIGRDITERKAAEENLRRLNRTWAMLSDVNQAIVRIHNLGKLFEKVCHIAVEQGGFRMGWVGLLDLETSRVNPVAHAGVSEDYLKKLDIVLGDEEQSNGPVGTALRSGKHVIANDIEHDSRMIPWREDALKLGYRATAAFPLKVANEVHGIFTLYAATSDFFDDDELKLLDEMADDISFAMEFVEQETQRQQAETALKQHVEAVEEMRLFLQTTLDAFPANTVVLNPDGTIINVNEGWIRFADENNGVYPMHYLGVNYLTVSDTSDGDWSEEAASTAAGIRAVIDASQDEFYVEYPCHSPSEKRWFRLNVTPFPEPAPRRVVVAHINITERRLAEEAEHEQRHFAEALRDSLAALTASLDVDTVMHQILNNAAQVVPYESASIIQFEGDTARASYLSGFSPEAEAFFKAFQYNKPYPEHLARIEENQPYLIADTRLIMDWINIPLTNQVRSSMGVPIIMTDGLLGMLSVDSSTPDRYTPDDVERLKIFARYAAIALENAYHALHLEQKVLERTAELQTAKERVETILNSSTDAILLLHHDFTIQQTNGAFNAMFACEQDDYFNKPLDVLLHSHDKDATTHILHAAAEHLRVREDVETQRKDGTVFTAELNIGFVNEESFVCAFHDISARKQVEHALQIAVEKEKELNELKSRFVSMASHEFRTPLASILAATETLTAYRHRLTDDEIGRKLSNIVEQVSFLKAIMDDVLQLARLQARRLEYLPSKVDLDTIWREILAEFQSRPDIIHHFHYICENILPVVQIDKKLMRQIISNLLSNAIKYSPPDKVITIKLEQVNDGIAFSVQDGGIGIPQDDMQHLFEPFHRASNVGTIHGTGLGLVITKEAVDLHDGTITVKSQQDVGTTFTVNLPISSKEM